MMNEIRYLILAFVVGVALGTLFFGGLWYTVKKAVTAKISVIWIFISFILRGTIVMIGFYFISSGGWKPIIISVIGFVGSRFIIKYLTKKGDNKTEKSEVNNEA